MTTQSFSVGEKVKIIGCLKGTLPAGEYGKIATVSEVTRWGFVRIQIVNESTIKYRSLSPELAAQFLEKEKLP